MTNHITANEHTIAATRIATSLLLVLMVLSSNLLAHTAFMPVSAVEDTTLVAVQHNAYLMTRPNGFNTSTMHVINTSNTSQDFYGTLPKEKLE